MLYCVYINDLLELLKYKDIGCHIGPTFYGALGYADDLILIAPSVQGTKDILKECQKYAVSHKIKFNANLYCISMMKRFLLYLKSNI